MKIRGGMMGDLASVPERARSLEADGYDGVITAEVANDPFLPLVLAAEHSERMDLMTSIAVAFARSPMTLAATSHDLNAFSKGRFVLGIGSQIKPHITRRFSMPWSKPAARMREFIQAMRAVWACWYEGAKLDFRGEFYQHTLMTPMFTPSVKTFGAPRVMLAAVGPLMTEVAGEVADGVIAHAFTTERYMREVTLPAIEKGLKKTGRSREGFEVMCPVFSVTGVGAAAREASRQNTCQQIAFYGSTPAYQPVLDLHGWGQLHRDLHRLSKRGEWVEMGERITDEVLDEFAIVAEPDHLAAALGDRYGALLDSWCATTESSDESVRRELIAAVKAIEAI